MIYSYCKKCKTESPGDTCRGCGKHATAAAQRDIWSIAAVPLADGRAWRGALYTLLAVVALLLALIFGLEAMVSGSGQVARMCGGVSPDTSSFCHHVGTSVGDRLSCDAAYTERLTLPVIHHSASSIPKD